MQPADKPAYKDDMLASAIVALARELKPAPECDRLARLALAVMALPAVTHEEELVRMVMLETVMGFGPLARARGAGVTAPAVAAPARAAAIIGFTPVPVAPRADGWTPERQRLFIEALADTGSVPMAARAAGMGVEGAYRLRRRPDVAEFAAAWDAALAAITRRLADAAFDRAIHGVRNPVFFRGELIGERVTYDERLTRFLLERHDPRGHGHLREAEPAWAAKRDPLAPKLAKLPKLLAKLFGGGEEAEA